MNVLVCYDVRTADPAGAKRLRTIARLCRDHGVRVQYSLFECVLEPREWLELRTRLLETIETDHDSLRFYFLHADSIARTEHHGVRRPLDVEGPLIL